MKKLLLVPLLLMSFFSFSQEKKKTSIELAQVHYENASIELKTSKHINTDIQFYFFKDAFIVKDDDDDVLSFLCGGKYYDIRRKSAYINFNNMTSCTNLIECENGIVFKYVDGTWTFVNIITENKMMFIKGNGDSLIIYGKKPF